MLSLLLENRKRDAADAHDARPAAAGETEKVTRLMLMMLSLPLGKWKKVMQLMLMMLALLLGKPKRSSS